MEQTSEKAARLWFDGKPLLDLMVVVRMGRIAFLPQTHALRRILSDTVAIEADDIHKDSSLYYSEVERVHQQDCVHWKLKMLQAGKILHSCRRDPCSL